MFPHLNGEGWVEPTIMASSGSYTPTSGLGPATTQ